MMKEEAERKVRLIRLLAANYGAELDEDITTLWLVLLAPYSAEQCRNAVLAVVRTCGFEAVRFGSLPPFALVQRELDACTGAVRGEKGAQLMAEAEWGKLLEAVRSSGAWREPELHPTTAFVVRQLGGWSNVCRWKEEELGWKRREFTAAWREASGREDVLALGARGVARLAVGAKASGPQAIGSRRARFRGAGADGRRPGRSALRRGGKGAFFGKRPGARRARKPEGRRI